MDKPPFSHSKMVQRLALLKPFRLRLAFAYLLMLLTSAVQLFYPSALSWFIDASIAGMGMGQLLSMGLLMVLLITAHAIAIAARHYLFNATGTLLITALRRRFFANLMARPIAFFDKEKTGDLSSRLVADIDLLRESLTSDLANLLQTLFMCIGAFVMLLLISPLLSLLILVLGPLMVLSMRLIGRRSRKLSNLRQAELARTSDLAQEVIGNIRLVKAFTRINTEQKRFDKVNEAGQHYALQSDRLFACFEGGATFVQSAFLLLTVISGGAFVAKGSISMGELMSFVLYATMAAGSASSVGAFWGEWMRSIGATDRVFELLREEDSEHSGTAKPLLSGDFSMQQVGFRYPSRSHVVVLEDISLHMEAGEKIAVVGASGAGKSTLINLIMGFYRPDSGDIYADGKPYTNIDLAHLRRHIAIVEQEPALFSTSIWENICYGATDDQIEEGAVIEAARNARLHHVIEDLPQGYQTQVGHRGLKLSGGQKQRVAIARALLRDPKLLILDEATSALDSESEWEVQQALTQLMRGRSTLIIAHRLSTVAIADRVLVLHQGRIIESGTPGQLIEDRSSAYYQLFHRQHVHSAKVAV